MKTEAKISTLKDLFEMIKQGRFIETYTEVKKTSGIRHRMAGTGTNTSDKKTELTEEDKQMFKAAFTKFFKEGKSIIDKL